MPTRGFSIIKTVDVSVIEPVSLDLLKKYVQVRSETHDELLNFLLTEARQAVENFLCVSLVETDITVQWEELDTEELPYGPVRTLTSVKDKDGADATHTVEGLEGSFISIKADRASPTVIVYVAGYADPIPFPIQLAIMKLVVDNFEARTGIAFETNSVLPNNWKHSCSSYSRLIWAS
jgi:uncharacterized phiE125 gp8 family phage protein